MLNPLIHASTPDTLQDVVSVLDFLEVLPYGPQQKIELSDQAAMGYFCIVQCIKSALLFESQRYQSLDSNQTFNRDDFRELKRLFFVLTPHEQKQLLQTSKQALDLLNTADHINTPV